MTPSAPKVTGKLNGKLACPGCGTLLDGFTALRPDTSPKAGDVSICAYCMATLIFVRRGNSLAFAKATPEEKAAINRELPDAHRARAAALQAARNLGREMK